MEPVTFYYQEHYVPVSCFVPQTYEKIAIFGMEPPAIAGEKGKRFSIALVAVRGLLRRLA
jgi:hypothetical protein